MSVWIMMLKRFRRPLSFMIVSILLFIGHTLMVGEQKDLIDVSKQNQAISGSLSASILSAVDYGDGTSVTMLVTNVSKKEIITAKALLVARDETRTRLMSDEQFVVKLKEAPLQPNESREVHFFLFDCYLEDVYFYSFVGQYVAFTES